MLPCWLSGSFRPQSAAAPAARCSALLLVLLALIVVWPRPAEAASRPAAQRIQSLRERIRALARKKEEKRAQLRQTKRAQRRLADQLNESYQRLEVARERLALSGARLRRAEAAVREATRRLRAAEQRLALQRKRFARRVALAYMEGPVGYLDVLLGARDVSDFLDREYYLSLISRRDASILSELRAARQAVAMERQRLLERREELEAAHRENSVLVAQVQQQAAERAELLRAIAQERALQEQRLQELEEDSAEVQRALEEELRRRLAYPRRYAALPRWTGRLARPAAGPIVSGFGYRLHPLLGYRRLHTGLDIAAPSGAPVYAAESGEVFFASWRGGYGQCIILLHGGGMSTLYGHLSRLYVRPGQVVRRGQVIGAVGSTGLSTGPHLHFEVRRNGVPVNPM